MLLINAVIVEAILAYVWWRNDIYYRGTAAACFIRMSVTYLAQSLQPTKHE